VPHYVADSQRIGVVAKGGFPERGGRVEGSATVKAICLFGFGLSLVRCRFVQLTDTKRCQKVRIKCE